MKIKFWRLLFTLLILNPFFAYTKTINPLDYGLLDARTGEDRFWALYKTHELACMQHWKVSYKGITRIDIDIPSNAKSIPLSDNSDFCNTQFIVTNTKKKNFYLFVLSQNAKPVTVTKKMIDASDFRSVKELRYGKKLLIIEDKNPWVVNRTGRNYGVTRRDVMLLRRGCAINKTISPYDNDFSFPLCTFVDVSNKKKVFKGISFLRTADSSEKTYLLKINNQNNVILEGLRIITPEPISMSGDVAIMVENCTRVYFSNIVIDGTYSFTNEFGYGIALNNVWDSYFDNIESKTAWGVFGNNNVNTVHMKNSNVNRFDAHCYARDFTFTDCEFSLVGLNQSSFMGDLVFDHCLFNNAMVCDSRYDYNAYTPFTITISNCTIFPDKRHASLVRLGEVPLISNSRSELQQKYSPSIVVKETKVVLDEQTSSFYLYQLGFNSGDHPIDHWGRITVENLKIVGKDKKMMIVNRAVESNDEAIIETKGVEFDSIDSGAGQVEVARRIIVNLKSRRQ